jgi:putative membrane protein
MHTFADFIPSVFIGCPNADTELSVLPGHQLLKEGKGLEAVYLSSYGGICAVILFSVLSVPLILLISKIFPLIKIAIPYVLISIIVIMILTESKKFSAIIVVILTGILGLCVLNLEIKEPLLPLLTGLFGSSTILLSIKQKTKIPKQNYEIEKLKIKKILRPLAGASISSFVCGFLPGLGTGQAAILGSQISKTDNKSFLILLGATNIFIMGISFISLYAISKTRTGSAVAIQELVGSLSNQIIFLIIIAIIISGTISFLLTLFLSKKFLIIFEKINYTKISIATLFVLSVVVLIFSGILGFFIMIISTFTGIFCISLGVKRTHMLNCLLIPTILLYLF